jgi:hypothetical protein
VRSNLGRVYIRWQFLKKKCFPTCSGLYKVGIRAFKVTFIQCVDISRVDIAMYVRR